MSLVRLTTLACQISREWRAQYHEGRYEDFPQLGRVIIEDNVSIGANVCVARGALGDTWIKKGSKLENLVQIGHNATIGENTLIMGHSQIAGSVNVGANVWIAPSVTTTNIQSIGDNAFVGIGSVVIRNVGKGERVFGNPAKKIVSPI